MGSLITLLEQYSFASILIIFILIILSGIGIYETVVKISGIFNNYHTNRTTKENKYTEIVNRIEKLEGTSNQHTNEIKDIKESISETRLIMDKMQDEQHRSNRATSRSAMYRLSNELIAKGWMTQTEYDTLSDLTDVYIRNGSKNDSYVRPSLAQRALQLPVLTDDEVENMKRKKKQEEE